MKAIEYRKQAEQRQAETGYNFAGICAKIAERMSNEELVSLGETEGHRRLAKVVRYSETATTERDKRMFRNDAETIATALIQYAQE